MNNTGLSSGQTNSRRVSSMNSSDDKRPVDIISSWLRKEQGKKIAVGNGLTAVTRPGDKLLKEVLDALEEGEKSFKGLKKDPESSSKA
eukprot:CAMPEP_0176120370 /NCGR_PEP_ID=MMETSP0120_2-20121206/60548_1 /TAXON_ID=160619 /ORGANISM="Kryptoperidinium foliaceum, Strain CCMP 1326" /LENGTH=87 /DNA_ID=CAMNT_0017454829 /DNA_START=1 /DNA_END=262 /DNA_ORIENTATION=+